MLSFSGDSFESRVGISESGYSVSKVVPHCAQFDDKIEKVSHFVQIIPHAVTCLSSRTVSALEGFMNKVANIDLTVSCISYIVLVEYRCLLGYNIVFDSVLMYLFDCATSNWVVAGLLSQHSQFVVGSNRR